MSSILISGEILDAALARIERLLGSDAPLAITEAEKILAVAPGHPVAARLLGVAKRLTGNVADSIILLEAVAEVDPDSAASHYELGRSYADAGRPEPAIDALRRAVKLEPAMPGAWQVLASQLRSLGDDAGADAVGEQRIAVAIEDPRVLEANTALRENRFAESNTLLRQHLEADPTDIVALRMLAEVGQRLRQIDDASMLLGHCLELAPNYTAARYDYAKVLREQMRPADALQEIEKALEAEPQNPAYRNFQAVLLDGIGEYDRAIEIYAGVLEEHPQVPRAWMSYGHSLRVAGRQADRIAAYRKSIELRPGLGEAWWGLADLKTYTFSVEDIDELRLQLDRPDLSDEDRLHFEFTLGKALEEAGDYPGSFAHYVEGNRLHRATRNKPATDAR
jgi:tetratricopeptide (TPR) repeat protein